MTLLLRPQLLGPLPRYMLMARHPGQVAVDVSGRYEKRDKSTHRFTIADTRGRLDITIPVARPESLTAARLADIRLSGHSSWWLTAMTALESAYGRTPYFEFYADDFRRIFTPERVGTPLVELMASLDSLVCRLAGIRPPAYADALPADAQPAELPTFHSTYWQVRSRQLGFISGLSILDPLFSLGPELLPLLLE